jgi:hypothetical protein
MITKFSRNSDTREGEIDVTGIPFEAIRKIVEGGPADPLLYDCYRLSAHQLERFRQHLPITIDEAGCDCYLEAEAGGVRQEAADKDSPPAG